MFKKNNLKKNEIIMCRIQNYDTYARILVRPFFQLSGMNIIFSMEMKHTETCIYLLNAKS